MQSNPEPSTASRAIQANEGIYDLPESANRGSMAGRYGG